MRSLSKGVDNGDTEMPSYRKCAAGAVNVLFFACHESLLKLLLRGIHVEDNPDMYERYVKYMFVTWLLESCTSNEIYSVFLHIRTP